LASNLGSGSGHFLFCVLSERVLEIHGVVCKTPSMTQHPKRPRDPAQLAKLMIDIASGEVEDKASAPDTAASEFARQGGLKGGRARAD
jgi:hypothetical protein